MELKPVVFELTGKAIFNPHSISISDSVLILFEASRPDNFISLFDFSDGSLLFEGGVRGRGPGEMSEIIQHTVSVKGGQSDGPSLFDWVNKQLLKLDIQSTVESGKITIAKSFTLPPELMLAQRAVLLDDKTAVASGGMHQAELAIIDTGSNEVTHKSYHEINESAEPRYLIELRRGELAVQMDRNAVLQASKWFPLFAVYDLDFNNQFTVQLQEYDQRAIMNQSEDERVLYIKDVKTTYDHIWILQIAKNQNEMMDFLEDNHTGNKSYISEVLRYSWTGELIDRFKLMDGFYQFIEIDETHNRIFSIDMMSDERDVVYFEM